LRPGLPVPALVLLFLSALLAAPHRLGPAQAPGNPAAVFDPARTFPAADLKADLGTLWDILDEGHAALDRFTPRQDLKRMFDEAGEGIASPLTELEFCKRVLPLVAAIEDGHTRLDPSPAAERFLASEPIHGPFVLRFVGGKAFIFRNLSADPGIAAGSEILSINGLGIADVLTRLMALIPSDAGIATRKLRLLEDPWVFGRLLAIEFDRPASFRLGLRPPSDGAPREATVPGIKAAEIAAVLKERYGEPAAEVPLYELSFRDKTAVLTVRALADDGAPGRPGFPDFLKQAFADIATRQAASLVVDLRECGGGRDDYAKLLFAHVAEQPFLYYRSVEAKKDRYDFFKFTSESPADAEDFARSVRKNDRGGFDVLGYPNAGPQSPERPVFPGRAAVLIGGGSASATGEAILLFHYNRRAVFLGEESGAAYGGTTGYVVTATLPHSGLRVRLPLVLTTMVTAGYPRDRGLLPEVPVEPAIEDLLAGRDPVMDRALKFLKNDEIAAELSPIQARALIESGDKSIIILDLRTPSEFAEGHLAKALNVDFRAPDFARKMETLDRKAAYLVYGRTGGRSFAAMGLMKSMGFLRVYSLAGGYLKWQEEWNAGPAGK
jgi:rhodanese-related sulfurtransferase